MMGHKLQLKDEDSLLLQQQKHSKKSLGTNECMRVDKKKVLK